MKKIFPALVCGFAAGVLNIVPIVKSLSCCVIIPFAAVLALYLDMRANNSDEPIRPGKAIVTGVLTGVFAAVFGTILDVFIIFITRSNELASTLPEIEKMIADLPASPVWNEVMDLMYKISDDITNKGFSFIYSFSLLISSLIINSLFGMIGALIGMQVINNRIKNSNK